MTGTQAGQSSVTRGVVFGIAPGSQKVKDILQKLTKVVKRKGREIPPFSLTSASSVEPFPSVQIPAILNVGVNVSFQFLTMSSAQAYSRGQ